MMDFSGLSGFGILKPREAGTPIILVKGRAWWLIIEVLEEFLRVFHVVVGQSAFFS